MCLFPQLIKNPKYKANEKNGGNIPAISDERVSYVPIGCGKCIECMKQRAMNWKIRLLEDVRVNKNGHFVTLTFSNESYYELYNEINKELKGYDIDNAIATLAVRRFLGRWRKKYKKSVRHWFVTELGHEGTENIHLHGIIWTDIEHNEIKNIWNYGFVWCGYSYQQRTYVNEATVNYITKYVNKSDEKHKLYKPIILCSPGIGRSYCDRPDFNRHKYNEDRTIEAYKTRSGHELNLPIYYRNKLYSDSEKEKLWLNKLDKNERFVLGVKIDVSEGDSAYINALKWARLKNNKLGFGGDQVTWEEAEYERKLRTIKQMERLKNAEEKIAMKLNNNKKKSKRK
ncbi:MAG: replication initiation protein [Malazfec virus 4]